MTDRRFTSTSTVAGAVLSLVVASLVLYVAGYFVLTKQVIEIQKGGPGPDERWRDYRYQWLATVYQPMAWIESSLTGDNVKTSNTIYDVGF